MGEADDDGAILDLVLRRHNTEIASGELMRGVESACYGRGPVCFFGSPQMGLDSRQQLPHAEGLSDVVIRANFKIKRSDFGINPGQMEEKVSDDIELNLSIAGAAQR